MSVRILSLRVGLVLFVSIFVHVATDLRKSNVTLEAEDKRAFFNRLRKTFRRGSSSSEESEDSPNRSKPQLTHFGEALISHYLSDAEEILREDLEEYMKNAVIDFSSFVRYKTFMTNQMFPLVDHYTVQSKRGKDGDKYCDFRYILTPRIGAGNTGYIIHFKIIEDPEKLKSKAKSGLNFMRNSKVGKNVYKKWPQTEKIVLIMIVFCGNDVALLWKK